MLVFHVHLTRSHDGDHDARDDVHGGAYGDGDDVPGHSGPRVRPLNHILPMNQIHPMNQICPMNLIPPVNKIRPDPQALQG